MSFFCDCRFFLSNLLLFFCKLLVLVLGRNLLYGFKLSAFGRINFDWTLSLLLLSGRSLLDFAFLRIFGRRVCDNCLLSALRCVLNRILRVACLISGNNRFIILFPLYQHNQCKYFCDDQHCEYCNANAEFCCKSKCAYQIYHTAPPCCFFLLVNFTTTSAPTSNTSETIAPTITITTFRPPSSATSKVWLISS